MVMVVHKGNFNKTEKFLKSLLDKKFIKNLDRYGQEGVQALANATPKDTGLAASSWDYEIVNNEGSVELWWTNDNVEGGVHVVILIQYGHGTRNGGYVQGIDFINPALKPIFNKIADKVWKEVVRL